MKKEITSALEQVNISSVSKSENQSNISSINGIFASTGASIPPQGNTGVERTGVKMINKKNQILVDWFAFTLKSEKYEEIFDFIGIDKDKFFEAKKGGNYYRRRLICGHISVYFDGAPGMGVHCEMSGQGCREFEQVYNYPWEGLFQKVLSVDAGVSRLDVCYDDFTDKIDMRYLIGKVKNREIKSRFKRGAIHEEFTIGDREVGARREGKTVYFGSKNSEILFRAYDKGAQTQAVFPWFRLEGQFRNGRATEFIRMMLKNTDAVGSLFAGVVNNYISILDENKKDSNKRRWAVNQQWREFIGSIEKISIATKEVIKKQLDDVKHWIFGQVAPSLAMLKQHYGTGGKFNQFVRDIVHEGRSKLKLKHILMLQQYNPI